MPRWLKAVALTLAATTVVLAQAASTPAETLTITKIDPRVTYIPYLPSVPAKTSKSAAKGAENSKQAKEGADSSKPAENSVPATKVARWIIVVRGLADPRSAPIKFLVNGHEQYVQWDGCSPTKVEAQRDVIHGYVKSLQEVEICNFPLSTRGELKLGLQQSDQRSDLPVIATNWVPWVTLTVAGSLTLISAAFVYFLLSFKGAHIIKGREYRLRALFLDKQTNTYSLSILQFHLWTIAAVFGYNYFALSRLFIQWDSLPEVSGNLPGIVGIGLGTAVGSQLINSVRPKGGGEEEPSPSDFLTSGGAVAPDRVQMLVWTLIAIAGFLAGVVRSDPASITELPGIPSSLMELMGLSSVGYLGAKFARKPGPNILEISILPAFAKTSSEGPTSTLVDLAQPISAANQVFQSVKAATAGLAASSQLPAVQQASAAVSALENAITTANAIQKNGSAGLLKLDELSSTSHAAATTAAAEFEKASGASAPETVRLSAVLAQKAAAAVEELTSDSKKAWSSAEAAAIERAQSDAAMFRRTIELRGQNLSAEGLFRATVGGSEYDLPFRMLEEKDGKREPQVIVSEVGDNKVAKTLRLTIAPSKLDEVDRKVYDVIFGQAQKEIVFTIFNPDGQKSVKTFSLPPGEAQRS